MLGLFLKVFVPTSTFLGLKGFVVIVVFDVSSLLR
jgi:hypothetical protein